MQGAKGISATSFAATGTNAPNVTVVQEAASDRGEVAAALATMQQAYIDDVNVDPLLLNCLSTPGATVLASVCRDIATKTDFVSQIISGKLLATLLRASSDKTMPTADKLKVINELSIALKNFQTALKPSAGPTSLGQ